MAEEASLAEELKLIEWVQRQKTRLSEYPSRSPDFNPIDMVWNDFKMP